MKNMTLQIALPLILAIALASQVTGHTGAKGVVKARMDSMGQIKESLKMLGTMAAGKTEFDAVQAKTAAGLIEKHAGSIVVLFQEKDISGPTEAREAIWSNWQDFVAQADDLASVAKQVKSKIATLDDVKASMPELGAACQSCHQDYRL